MLTKEETEQLAAESKEAMKAYRSDINTNEESNAWSLGMIGGQ